MPTTEELLEDGEVSSEEEAFMKGYNNDEEVVECVECGSAIPPGKEVVKDVEGEKYKFCSKICADEFEENSTN